MRILVVHPEYVANREIVYMPLGLAYLSAVAEREGHQVELFDMHNLRLSRKELRKKLESASYGACLMGGFALQVRSMAECAAEVRRAQPSCKIILGGVGVSDIPEIAMNCVGADAVAIGESELTLPKALKSIEERRAFEGCLGFVHRAEDGSIVKQPRGPVPEDLDSLPWPAYHLFDIERISRRSYNGRGERSIHMLTSRGCPFKCNFCINSVLNSREMLTRIHGEIAHETPKTQRTRSPAKLVEEIQFVRSKYGINDFHFADEEFITNRRRLEEVCAALKPLGITWSTSGRADWANEDKLRRMKDAGCQYVLFGVETGSQDMLDFMDKKAKKPAVEAGLASARKAGMSFIANFMIGHPGESSKTVSETVEFCKRNRLIFLPSFVTLFPNSRMFHDFAPTVRSWDRYFRKLSTIDFSRQLFKNLTDLPDWKLKYLRNWAVSETLSHALAPSLPRPLHSGLTRAIQAAMWVSDHAPNWIRWILRDLLRNAYDFNSPVQVPPNRVGQASDGHVLATRPAGAALAAVATEDAYEQSLQSLQL